MTTDPSAAIERHIELLERHAYEVIAAAAREQEAFAADGRDFFALNWVDLRNSMHARRRSSRIVLRSVGIRNIEGEVLRLVAAGCSSTSDVHAGLVDAFGDVIQIKQIHRALHKLAARNAIQRIARNTYQVPQEADVT